MPTFAQTEVSLSEAIAALGAFAKPTESKPSKPAMLVERPADVWRPTASKQNLPNRNRRTTRTRR
jgi:hypothetical protein